jgi:hypothetical protein
MKLTQRLTAESCVLLLATLAGPAHSTPLGSATGHVKSSDVMALSYLQQAAYRLCMAQGGVQRCRWVDIYGPGVYGYQAPSAPIAGANLPPPPIAMPVFVFRPGSRYRSTDPDNYPLGSTPWWQSMDYWDLGGRSQ